ncbi:MAG: glycoside hydrolase family 32 protein [Clostridia bacterium]|nr:glycoside hydrolase family 32 protein [Clostridia bacterium]
MHHSISYRDRLLSDPYRPQYHFAAMDRINISDPNGAFYADGRYHLMYLYVTKRDERGDHCCWGHVSSSDLVHWRHHKDAIGPIDGDNGCYSGGAYLDDDGTAYITFWKFPSVNGHDHGGTAIAYAKPPYEDWTRIEPIAIDSLPGQWGITETAEDGRQRYVGNADPSNIWKMNGYYYMETGNKIVLEQYGMQPESDVRYCGGWTDLYKSKDLRHWEYVHRFMEHTNGVNRWTDQTEDHMCSSLFPLPDKAYGGTLTDHWLEMFISHNIGSQYFIGKLDEAAEVFIPEQHGRFTWQDRTCFAPEAMLDADNRQIAWFVLHDDLCDYTDDFDWFGVYTMPRTLWFENNTLHMFPVEELTVLQTNHQKWDEHIPKMLPVKNGRSCHIHAEFRLGCTENCGFTLLYDPQTGQGLHIYYDVKRQKLIFDGSCCGEYGIKRKTAHKTYQIVDIEEAPLALREDEALELDIWIDHSVVEVFANQRQAISRRFYADDPENAVQVLVIGHDAITYAEAWKMHPSNPY